MATGAPAILVTCEHATARVPQVLRPLFAGARVALGGDPETVLRSHRGWDAGAAELARLLGQNLKTEPLLGTYSRLVVDLNRSIHHPRLFSPVTRPLPLEQRQRLARQFYLPHWQRVVERVQKARRRRQFVVQLACHSFVPVLHGRRRLVDVGLLYDPRRPTERRLADALAQGIARVLPHWRLCRNQPYRGRADGLPTALRSRLGDHEFAGFEIEVSQQKVYSPFWLEERQLLAAALCHVFALQRV